MDSFWWLVLVLIAAATMSSTTFLDNYNVDVVFRRRSPISQKVIYAFLEIITIAIIWIIHPPVLDNFESIIFVVLSGTAYASALIPYYYALKYGNATIAEIFEQTLPIASLLLGMIFLGEALTGQQLLAFGIILFTEFFVIFARKNREKITSLKAAGFSILSVLLWAFADLFFAKSGNDDYVSALFFLLVGRAVVDFIFVLTHKKERQYCAKILKKSGIKKLWPTFVDFVIEIGSDVTYRLALLLAPIAIVSVTYKAAELVFVFLFGIILTKIWPKFGREKLDKRTVRINSCAIVLMVVGILLLG